MCVVTTWGRQASRGECGRVHRSSGGGSGAAAAAGRFCWTGPARQWRGANAAGDPRQHCRVCCCPAACAWAARRIAAPMHATTTSTPLSVSLALVCAARQQLTHPPPSCTLLLPPHQHDTPQHNRRRCTPSSASPPTRPPRARAPSSCRTPRLFLQQLPRVNLPLSWLAGRCVRSLGCWCGFEGRHEPKRRRWRAPPRAPSPARLRSECVRPCAHAHTPRRGLSIVASLSEDRTF